MPRRDPLLALARLRKIERDAARMDFARARGALGAAEAREAAAAAAITREAVAAPADYAAWLPAGFAARERATVARSRAEATAEAARRELAAARAAEAAVQELLAARHAAERRERLTAQQVALEDAASSLRATPPLA